MRLACTPFLIAADISMVFAIMANPRTREASQKVMIERENKALLSNSKSSICETNCSRFPRQSPHAKAMGLNRGSGAVGHGSAAD